MGKSTGFRFAGNGPGLQKKSKLAKRYLQGKNASKRGSMADLDFGVEVAEKPAKHIVETGLNGLRERKPSVLTSEHSVAAQPGGDQATNKNPQQDSSDNIGPSKKKAVKSIGKKAAPTEEKIKRDAAAAQLEEEEKRAKRLALLPKEGVVIPGAAVGVGLRINEKVGQAYVSKRVGDMEADTWARQEALRRTEEKKKKKCAPC